MILYDVYYKIGFIKFLIGDIKMVELELKKIEGIFK